ncbi:MAG: PPC domain-containing protein, partial [Cyanobacteria bacterium J06632_19]
MLYWRHDGETTKNYIIDVSEFAEFTVKKDEVTNKKIIIGVEAIDDDVAEKAESVTVELVEFFYAVDSNNKSVTLNIKDNEPTLEFVGVKNAKEYDTLLPDDADSDTIGYVELKADKPIKNSIGLWVKYTITAVNNVIEGVDYLSSQYRKVSFQPSTQDKGIIIPTSEALSSNNEGDADKIRIYFAALPDAIKENDEDIKIEIQPYHFDLESTGNQQISNYFLKQNNNIVDKITTSIKVEDSGLYSNQVLVFDSVGQLISQRNPLALTDDKTTFQVKLGSEPLENVTVNFIPPQPKNNGSLKSDKITKKEGTEANDQVNQAISIESTEFVFNGEISNNKDIDTFKVNLKAGDKIKIDVDARAIKLSQVDSQINLLNSNKEVIRKNDDNSGDNYDPLVEYKIAQDGIYYIQVVYSEYYGSSGTRNSSGKYQLKVNVTPVETKSATKVEFTRENWDKLQTVTVEGINSGSNLTVTTSSRDSNYKELSLNLPFTTTPPSQVVVKEGESKQDLGKPLVSVFAVGEANSKEPVLRESNLEPGKFIIQLNRAVENDVKVKYTLSGSAELKSDYSGNFEKDSQNSNSYTVTIPKGETSVTLSVDPEADDIEEKPETIIVTLNELDAYKINSNDKSKTITLIDSNRVGFQLGNVNLDGNITPTFRTLQTTEGGDSDTFAIRLRSQPKSDVTVNFSGLNSKENSIATAKVTFTPQNWNQYQSVKVTGIADNKVDDNVTYELQAKATSDDQDYNGQTIPITITNQNIDEKVESVNSTRPDPTLPMVTLEGTNTTFTENADGSAKVKVILDQPAPKDGLTVFLSLDRSTATWQQDFNINTNLFLNQSGTNNPFDKVKVDKKKVGKYSYPTFADLDGDKDLDLVVGNSKGTLKFYRNVGTEFIPFFREEI